MKSALVFGVLVCWLEMVAVTEATETYFRMKHINSGKVAEVYPGTYEDYTGKLVRIWDRDDVNRADEQRWYEDSGSCGTCGGVFFRNKKHPSMVLGLGTNSQNWGLPAFLAKSPCACDKRWSITGDHVQNLGTGKLLTLKDGVTTNGNQVLVETADQSTDQDWVRDYS